MERKALAKAWIGWAARTDASEADSAYPEDKIDKSFVSQSPTKNVPEKMS